MACDRLVFRRYINFLLCLYIDLWTLKNFVIINSNTSFVLILFFFIDFFLYIVKTLSYCLICYYGHIEYVFLSVASLLMNSPLFPLPLWYFAKEKKKKRIYKFYMSSGTIYHGISRFALPYLVRNVT